MTKVVEFFKADTATKQPLPLYLSRIKAGFSSATDDYLDRNMTPETDIERYNQWMVLKSSEWEAKCTRCGACCGALDDPCENLHKNSNGRFYCAVYEKRFGKWHTVSGKEMTCVPIRDKIAQGHSWPGDEHCGYK